MAFTEDLKSIIAKNISELRKSAGITQLELAEMLNYSDKAVSKWERGESVPDISVLKRLAEILGVTVDYLICEHTDECKSGVSPEVIKKIRTPYRALIAMCVLLVWLIAAGLFVLFNGALKFELLDSLLSFLYAVPVSFIVWLVLNSVWFEGRHNYAIISALMWTVIASIQLTFAVFGKRAELMYLLGLPGQAIIISWSIFSKRRKIQKNEKADG